MHADIECREQPEYHSVSPDEHQPTEMSPVELTEQIIRWDEAGEVIIIEKPLELSHKILPAVYRQSRFASFSRQLNVSLTPDASAQSTTSALG